MKYKKMIYRTVFIVFFVLFGQMEFARLLRKHNVENTGHIGTVYGYIV